MPPSTHAVRTNGGGPWAFASSVLCIVRSGPGTPVVFVRVSTFVSSTPERFFQGHEPVCMNFASSHCLPARSQTP